MARKLGKIGDKFEDEDIMLGLEIRRVNSSALLSLLLPFAFLTAMYFLPLLILLSSSFLKDEITAQYYRTIFTEGAYINVIFKTLFVAGMVAAICGLVGTYFAVALSKCSSKMKTVFQLSLLIPLLVNPLALILGWTYLLQRQGVLNTFLTSIGIFGQPHGLLYNLGAVLTVMSYMLVPLVTFPIYSLLRSIDPQYFQAGRNLGAGPFALMRFVTLPLVGSSILASTILVFLLAVGYFIGPALVGGAEETMVSMLIENRVNYLGDLETGSALAVVLLVTVLFILFVLRKPLKMPETSIKFRG